MINLKNEKYDKEKIIKKLINFVEKNGRKPKGKEYKPEYKLPVTETVIKYFGSLSSLYKICETEISKFEEMEFQKRKKKVIEKVKSFMEREKRLPKQLDYQMRKGNLPTLSEVTKYFKSMGNLNEECTGIKK